MLRAFLSVSVVLFLTGCVHAPLPKLQPHVAHKVIVAKPKAPAVTPNQIVKKRWYDRFKVHPKWFHG